MLFKDTKKALGSLRSPQSTVKEQEVAFSGNKKDATLDLFNRSRTVLDGQQPDPKATQDALIKKLLEMSDKTQDKEPLSEEKQYLGMSGQDSYYVEVNQNEETRNVDSVIVYDAAGEELDTLSKEEDVELTPVEALSELVDKYNLDSVSYKLLVDLGVLKEEEPEPAPAEEETPEEGEPEDEETPEEEEVEEPAESLAVDDVIMIEGKRAVVKEVLDEEDSYVVEFTPEDSKTMKKAAVMDACGSKKLITKVKEAEEPTIITRSMADLDKDEEGAVSKEWEKHFGASAVPEELAFADDLTAKQYNLLAALLVKKESNPFYTSYVGEIDDVPAILSNASGHKYISVDAAHKDVLRSFLAKHGVKEAAVDTDQTPKNEPAVDTADKDKGKGGKVNTDNPEGKPKDKEAITQPKPTDDKQGKDGAPAVAGAKVQPDKGDTTPPKQGSGSYQGDKTKTGDPKVDGAKVVPGKGEDKDAVKPGSPGGSADIGVVGTQIVASVQELAESLNMSVYDIIDAMKKKLEAKDCATKTYKGKKKVKDSVEDFKESSPPNRIFSQEEYAQEVSGGEEDLAKMKELPGFSSGLGLMLVEPNDKTGAYDTLKRKLDQQHPENEEIASAVFELEPGQYAIRHGKGVMWTFVIQNRVKVDAPKEGKVAKVATDDPAKQAKDLLEKLTEEQKADYNTKLSALEKELEDKKLTQDEFNQKSDELLKSYQAEPEGTKESKKDGNVIDGLLKKYGLKEASIQDLEAIARDFADGEELVTLLKAQPSYSSGLGYIVTSPEEDTSVYDQLLKKYPAEDWQLKGDGVWLVAEVDSGIFVAKRDDKDSSPGVFLQQRRADLR